MSRIITIGAVKKSISIPRLSTYETAAKVTNDYDQDALTLYAWNAQVSAELFILLHICEVVIRNTVSDVLTQTYGDRWPWSVGFLRSLANPTTGYSPHNDLKQTSRNITTKVGQLIPEMKFAFWQHMFTSRHEVRIWQKNLKLYMPNLDKNKSVKQLLNEIYFDLDHVRKLRNRIAHHEPIFKRNLIEDYLKINNLVNYRCHQTSKWMINNFNVAETINCKPIF